MNGKTNNSVISILLAGITVLSASCGGGNVMENTSPALDQQALIEQAITSDAPQSLGKTSSGWEQWGGIGDLIDWYVVWLGLHQSVGYGVNELDETKLIGKSSGVYNFEDGGKDYINFPAADGGLNYVEIGLKDIPEGAIIRGISFKTDFNSSESPDAGYYVAYSNYETASFQWYGPFPEGEVNLYNFFTDTVNENNRAYFTIALVDNNHWSDITDIKVHIDDPIDFKIPDLIEKQPIPNWWLLGEDGRIDWDILFEKPDFQRINFQPRLMF
jgi:hypothetical protein